LDARENECFDTAVNPPKARRKNDHSNITSVCKTEWLIGPNPIPTGGPLGKPTDPSTIGTTHANAQAFENANVDAGLVKEETTTTPTQ